MRRAPPELEDLLSPRGRRILASGGAGWPGALARTHERLLALPDVLVESRAAALRDLLERRLLPAMTPMDDPIPPWTVRAMRENYAELLPKTVRVRTALLESRRARAYRIAEEIGLVALLRSASFHAFATALAGRTLKKRHGIQALCYGPGDYAGPHNDHHPEEPDARDGYLDVHLTLSTPAVAHQWLVYEREGHLSEVVPVHTVGGITAYALPFWHYTTPLVARRGKAEAARRWVLLGTFLYAD